MTRAAAFRYAVYLYGFGLACAFFYAGAGVFGVTGAIEDATTLDAHRAAGMIVQLLALILLVTALITKPAGRAITLCVVVFVVSVLQSVWAGLGVDHRYLGGLHTLGAMVLAVLVAILMRAPGAGEPTAGVSGRR